MRYRFLLDLNVLYHAIRGVNEFDAPDKTAAQLIDLIGRICHSIVLHKSFVGEYWKHLARLVQQPAPTFEAVNFINEFLRKTEKRSIEYDDLPELPPGVLIPQEDLTIARSALISRPILVTADRELREAINAQPALGLTAYTPKEALDFVKTHPVED